MAKAVWNSTWLRIMFGYLLIAGVIMWIYNYKLQHFWYVFYVQSNLPQSGWGEYILWYIPQELLYCILPLVLYLLVVHPLKLRPLTQCGGLSKHVITFICVVVTFLLLTPFSALQSASALMGIVYAFTGFSEEWMFRGVFLGIFRDRIGVILACVLSALLFGLYHWANDIIQLHGVASAVLQGMSSQTVFGLVLSVIVIRSRSILWVGILHCFADWQPWTAGGRSWITVLNILPDWVGGQYIMIFLIGLIGGEVIRLVTNIISSNQQRSELASSSEPSIFN